MTIKWTKKDVIKAFSDAMAGEIAGVQPNSLVERLKQLANTRRTGEIPPTTPLPRV